MIKTVNGNLLEAEENLIVHSVNCQGVMGSGVAKHLRDKYPIIFEKYSKICDSFYDKTNLLGQVQIIKVEHSISIVNLFGQFNYGRDGKLYTDYAALKTGFTYIRDVAHEYGLNIAMPYGIGCGLGGANWDTVYRMIEEIFEECDVTLYKLEEN